MTKGQIGQTINFFQRQDEARKKTSLLVVLFFAAVFLTFLAVHSLVVIVVASNAEPFEGGCFRVWFQPELLLIDFLCVGLVIGGGSLFKIASLSSLQGDGIATSLGGRFVPPDTTDPQEKRFRNIVEEMAIASGIQVPNIYVLDNEEHINAFAAGFTPNTSVIAVTKGALDYLDRDELQGVIAHEFSHILNGDTRINLRLIGVLFGLEMIVLIGYLLCRNVYMISFSSSEDRKDSGLAIVLAIYLFSLGLMVIGSIGMFFSNIIRSSVSRQREFLADASAVQFTRNPNGIGGALKKIGSPAVGSAIDNTNVAECSHLFIGSVYTPGFFNSLFDSHPPLEVRIKRLIPSFDGVFDTELVPIDPMTGRTAVPTINDPTTPPKDPLESVKKAVEKTGLILGDLPKEVAVGLGSGVTASSITASVGTIESKKLKVAKSLLETIPPEVSEFIREKQQAMAAIYAMLLPDLPKSETGATELYQVRIEKAFATSSRLTQAWGSLEARLSREMLLLVSKAAELLEPLAISSRLPLVVLTFPALKQLSVEEYKCFRDQIVRLVQVDDKVDLFEYTLGRLLLRELDDLYGLAKKPSGTYRRMSEVAHDFQLVLSYLAWSGSDQQELVEEAFHSALEVCPLNLPLLAKEQCRPHLFGESLDQLGQAVPSMKQKLLTAFYQCIVSDGIITDKEGELIRVIAAALDLPMPIWSGYSARRKANIG